MFVPLGTRHEFTPGARACDGREVISRLRRNKTHQFMVAEGLLPPPTYVKIDVQGFEKRVLDGMGEIMDRVVAIELELRLVPAYHGETLFPAMFDF